MHSPAEILRITDHRPWNLPSRPWVMRQCWSNLLFAHWHLAAESLRALIPKPLTIDTFEGESWVGITTFYLQMGPRGLPIISRFPELNCRTYVELGGKPGVFFFSLDAGSRLAVWGARTFYRLPYFYADMTLRKENHSVKYVSRRSGASASFVATYFPQGLARRARRGELEHWLTERYCLYTYSGNHLYRGEIHHLPWPLQAANCEIYENSIALAAGIQLPESVPFYHFARELDVLIWPLELATAA